jgi:hypothetical protein
MSGDWAADLTGPLGRHRHTAGRLCRQRSWYTYRQMERGHIPRTLGRAATHFPESELGEFPELPVP